MARARISEFESDHLRQTVRSLQERHSWQERSKLAKNSDRSYLTGLIGTAMCAPRGTRTRDRADLNGDDKDYALNSYETHHLHLDTKRTEELLYVAHCLPLSHRLL